MKKISTLKKKIALLLALLMVLSAVPAAIAVSQDWAMLTITLEWNDQDGVSQTVSANPVYDAPGSFWAYLPAPVSPGTVMLKAYCDMHPEWTYYIKTEPYREDVYPMPVGEGIILDFIPEAYDQLNGMSAYIEIQAVDPMNNAEVYHLFISTSAPEPLYIDVTPEPTETPTPEPETPTPEPETPTPEPETPTPEPETPTPEPETPTLHPNLKHPRLNRRPPHLNRRPPHLNLKHPHLNRRHLRPNLKHPRLNLKHPHPNLKRSRLNLKHLRPNRRHPRLNRRHLRLCLHLFRKKILPFR